MAVYPMTLGPGRSRSFPSMAFLLASSTQLINCGMGTSSRGPSGPVTLPFFSLHSIDSRGGRDLHQTVRDSGMFPSIVWSRNPASFTTPGTRFGIRRACGNHAIPIPHSPAPHFYSTRLLLEVGVSVLAG